MRKNVQKLAKGLQKNTTKSVQKSTKLCAKPKISTAGKD